MSTERILIISLIMTIIALAILFTIVVYRLREDISGMQDAYALLMKSYDRALDVADDINTKYAKCLDDREKFLNETNVRIKKLEIEIDKRDSEIARMDAIINYARFEPDRDPVPEETENEKEEVKKED